jgi:hypothetical protein
LKDKKPFQTISKSSLQMCGLRNKISEICYSNEKLQGNFKKFAELYLQGYNDM